MNILAVDTSTRTGSLAAFRGEQMLGEISSEPGEPYSSRLFRDLEQLLNQTRLALNEFDLFAVGAGPGSFTGLRVGLTAVKAWGELYGRRVAAVSGLEAVASQANAAAGQWLAPVIDARRGQVFGALYRPEAVGSANGNAGEIVLCLAGDEVILDAEEFVTLALEQAQGAPVEFVSPAPEVLEAAMQSHRLCSSCVVKVSNILAPSIGRLGYQKARRGELIDALHLDANYVRRSDAEVHWKGF